MRMSVALLSGLLIAAPASAQVTSGGAMGGSGAQLEVGAGELPEQAEDQDGEDGERRICRRLETDSVSRMASRRVCLTARQWREHQRRN